MTLKKTKENHGFSKYIRGGILSIIISLVVISLLTGGLGFNEVKTALFNYSWLFALAAFGVLSLKWFFEVVTLQIATGVFKRISFFRGFKIIMVVQLLNLITPFYTGGQPAAIYLLSQEGLTVGHSTAIIMLKSIMFQLFLTFFGIFSLSYLYASLNTLTLFAALVGLFINGTLVLLILLFGIKKTLAKKFLNVIILVLKKFKVLKQREKAVVYMENQLNIFNREFKRFKGEPMRLTGLFLFAGLQFSAFIFTALVILKGYGINFSLETFTRVFLVNTSSLIVPTPGTSGGAETLYFIFLKGTGNENLLGASMIIWRLCTYYFAIGFTALFSIFAYNKRELIKVAEQEKE